MNGIFRWSADRSVPTVCDRIIKISYSLLFLLVPIILTPWNYELFEFNKMMTTYALTAIIGGAWVVKMLAQGRIRIAKTPLDIPLALFLSSQLLSSLFSIDPFMSWFGYYSRFNGGMWSIISYVTLYYAFVSNFSETPTPSAGELRGMNYELWKKQNKTKPATIIHNTTTIIRLLKLSLLSATLVALYGFLERMGIDKNLWVQDVQTRVFSTLGQPNWLAAYLVALAPLAWSFALQIPISKHQIPNKNNLNFNSWNLEFVWNLRFGFWMLTALLFFTVLLFTRSRSGLLGFAIADVVFWAFLSLRARQKQSEAISTMGGLPRLRQTADPRNDKKIPFIIYHLSFIIIIFINGTSIPTLDKFFSFQGIASQLTHTTTPEATASAQPVGPALETGGTESGTIRKYVWQGAINAWKSSPKTMFIGTGTETFALAFYQFKPIAHNLTSEWDFLYNKAHNEYLNYLATTGVFGLGSYLLFIGTFTYWFVKIQMSKSKAQNNVKIQSSKQNLNFGFDLSFGLLPLALFCGWLSILVTNFFGFSVVIVQLMFFLFPAIVVSLSGAVTMGTFTIPLRGKSRTILQCIVLICTALVLYHLVNMWRGDVAYALGYRANRYGSYPQAETLLTRAIALNGAAPLYHDERATTLANLAVAAINEKQSTAGAEFARQSIEENDKALSISPRNVTFWKTRTKIFYGFSDYDPEFTKQAISAMNVAYTLSPQDPKIVYNLAVLYGQNGDKEKAEKFFIQAISLKSNYRDAYWGLFIVYTEDNQKDKARTILQKYLDTIDATDKEFIEHVK